MKKLESSIQGALLGELVTLVIQSSATVGIAIMLASQGLISAQAGIAIMLGAEIGTCSDTLLAVIGRSKEAIRAGVFHLLFNVVCVIAGLILIQPLVGTVDWISGDASPGRRLANAHTLFNIVGVVIFAWFIPYFHRALNALIR